MVSVPLEVTKTPQVWVSKRKWVMSDTAGFGIKGKMGDVGNASTHKDAADLGVKGKVGDVRHHRSGCQRESG